MKTFVSDEWTLEYDLAHAGLAKDMWVAAHLAKEDDQINAGKRKLSTKVITDAESSFTALDEEDESGRASVACLCVIYHREKGIQGDRRAVSR